MMVITAASREKLRKLQGELAEQSAVTARGLAECHAAQRFYGEEGAKIDAAREAGDAPAAGAYAERAAAVSRALGDPRSVAEMEAGLRRP